MSLTPTLFFINTLFSPGEDHPSAYLNSCFMDIVFATSVHHHEAAVQLFGV